MADVTPKINQFIFIGIVCMLINLAVGLVTFAVNDTANLDDYIITQDKGEDVGIEILGINMGLAWLPFVDIIPMTFLDNANTHVFMQFVYIVTAILGAIKLYLLIIIIVNFIPTVNV